MSGAANDSLTLFRFPTWLLLALGTVIGATAWLRFSWRFSLHRLLIATTLVAVLLGLIVAVAGPSSWSH